MISSVAYLDNGKVVLGDASNIEDAISSGSVWVDIIKPTDEDIEFLEKNFSLHRLCLDDIKNPVHTPKIDEYDGYMFVNLHSPKLKEDRFRRKEHDFVIGKNFLITSHHGSLANLETLKKKVESDSSTFSRGLDFVMYNVVSSIVDTYIPVLNKIEKDVDSIEDEAFEIDSKEMLKKMIDTKKLVVDLKRISGPDKETINTLTKQGYPYFAERSLLYFKDAYDRIQRINERSDSSRDLLTSSMEAHLSMISMRMNEIIELLTIIFTITIPPTLVATFYGMNFGNMPLSQTQNGFFIVVGLSLMISLTMAFAFKKMRWL